MNLDSKKKTILLIDDAITHLQQIKDILGTRVNIVPTPSAAVAFRAIDNVEIDLFLVDIHMPEVNGVDFVKKLRQHPKHKSTPVIFVTSEKEIDFAMDVITSDIVGYIKKPFNESFLRQKVFEVLEM